MTWIPNPGHFLLNNGLSFVFSWLTTRKTNLNLLSRFDDNYISGIHGAPNKGRAWVNFCTTSGAFTLVEITTIGDEHDDTNFDDHNNHDRAISNLGLFGIYDTDRLEYPCTRRWACPNLRHFADTCPVDVNDWPASSA